MIRCHMARGFARWPRSSRRASRTSGWLPRCRPRTAPTHHRIRPRRGREVSASVAAVERNEDAGPSGTGYFPAIIVSAIGHLALFALVFFVAPRYLHQPDAPPPAYTVKIVDNIPAGDLGTHLPRINRHHNDEAKAQPKPEEPKVKVEAPKPPELAPNDDKNALALNTKKLDSPTQTPTPDPTVA